MTTDHFTRYYDIPKGHFFAEISLDVMAKLGGWNGNKTTAKGISPYVNLGIGKMAQWCRQNCKMPGFPANVDGKIGWAFQHSSDALLFKLTWG
jgi:hypothetical protein